MTIRELYAEFNAMIPEELREEWDNDGLMCSADASAEVHRVLCTLDVTEEVVDYAIERCFDLIISHHPLIFHPVRAMNEENHTARKLIKLIENGISVFSFHTRLDKVDGGVNDLLCDALGMYDTRILAPDLIGRVGELDEEMTLEDFVCKVKMATGADIVKYADGYNRVKRVAVVGGDGKDYLSDALEAGADTFLSGRLSYNLMVEAAERGINLIEAGHFFTEQPVTEFFSGVVSKADPNIYTEVISSNNISTI